MVHATSQHISQAQSQSDKRKSTSGNLRRRFHKSYLHIYVAFFLSGCVIEPLSSSGHGRHLPDGFVYLKDVAPEIVQDLRYAGNHNFVGRPIAGYKAPVCILTRPAAIALANASAQLQSLGLTLKVYDCYRPTRAVMDFFAWSKQHSETAMKAEFYPSIDKKDFFDLGYVALKSGHSRGSTVDLAIQRIGAQNQSFELGQALFPCTNPITGMNHRFDDGTLDFGTGYDCMHPRSWPDDGAVGAEAIQNRNFLTRLMRDHGFVPYDKEWWHFTLMNEPYRSTYFDFPVE